MKKFIFWCLLLITTPLAAVTCQIAVLAASEHPYTLDANESIEFLESVRRNLHDEGMMNVPNTELQPIEPMQVIGEDSDIGQDQEVRNRMLNNLRHAEKYLRERRAEESDTRCQGPFTRRLVGAWLGAGTAVAGYACFSVVSTILWNTLPDAVVSQLFFSNNPFAWVHNIMSFISLRELLATGGSAGFVLGGREWRFGGYRNRPPDLSRVFPDDSGTEVRDLLENPNLKRDRFYYRSVLHGSTAIQLFLVDSEGVPRLYVIETPT